MIDIISKIYRAYAFLRKQRREGFLSVGPRPIKGGNWKDDVAQAFRLYEAYGCRGDWQEREPSPTKLSDVIGLIMIELWAAAQVILVAGGAYFIVRGVLSLIY